MANNNYLGSFAGSLQNVSGKLAIHLEQYGTNIPDFVASLAKPENEAAIKEIARLVEHCAERITASPLFANEEEGSNYGYPSGYAVKPIEWQAELLTRSFQDNLGIKLDARETLACARDLPDINSLLILFTGEARCYINSIWNLRFF